MIVNALIGNMELLREEAESMPATIGDAFVLVGNAMLRLVGQFDQITGSSSRIADVLITLADNLDRVAIYAATAATIIGGRYVAAIVMAKVGTLGLVGVLGLLKRALLTTGIGALVVVAGELVYRFASVTKAVGGLGKALGMVADVGFDICRAIYRNSQCHSIFL